MQPTHPTPNQPGNRVLPPIEVVANLLKNGNFNQPPDRRPQTLVTTPPGWGYKPSCAPSWDMDNNQPGITTTALFPSTLPGSSGTMLQVCTSAIDGGIRQVFGSFNTGPAKTISEVWVYVLSGKVGMGTGNGGGTSSLDDVSQYIGQWEPLKSPEQGHTGEYVHRLRHRSPKRHLATAVQCSRARRRGSTHTVAQSPVTTRSSWRWTNP